MSVAHGPNVAPPAIEAALAELNVLAVIDHLSVGGAEMLLGQFAAAAPALGIRLSVAHLVDSDGNPAAAPLREAGIEPVNLDVRGRPGIRHLQAMRRHIRAVQPDIVHTHMGTSDLVGGLAARSLGVPRYPRSMRSCSSVPEPRAQRMSCSRSVSAGAQIES